MLIIFGAMTAAGGLFLFLWYRAIVAAPVRRQPLFIHAAAVKWGVPAISLILFAMGLFLLAAIRAWYAVAACGAGAALISLVLKFDRYSANIRLIYDRYLTIRRVNPEMEEVEILFHTARWRYPRWTEDRIVELVAAKDIQSLILLMLISENKINPISDWDLYRSLQVKVDRFTQKGK